MARRTRLFTLALAVVATMAAVLVLGGDSPGAAGELARRLAAADDPDGFGFEHRAGGTRVLDCILPNRAVSGTVDYRAGVAVLRNSAGVEVARKEPERALLHRSLFADGAVTETWLAVDLPVGDDVHEALTRTLGTELAGYLLVTGLPTSGRSTAAAALDAAERVERLGAATVDGRTATGYRITVAAEKFTAATTGATVAGERDVQAPVLDVWINARGEVARVTVLPGGPDDVAEEVAGGWTVDYQPLGSPVAAGEPSSVSDLADIAVGRLVPPASLDGCEVPL